MKPTPFGGWLAATRQRFRLPVLGEGATVPCGTCSACCRASLFIHIRPDETQTLARIPRRLVFPAPGAPKGHVVMGYNERGECPMWTGAACAIYDHRPQTCRDFDCRVLAATGLTDDDHAEIAAQAARWKFTYRGAADRSEHARVRAAAAFLRDHGDAFPAGRLPRHPAQLAALAIRVYDVIADRLAGEARPSDTEIARAVLEALET
ncbi:MAG TPA: YkgJ family cysteine cluster protein [Kofleriaceae bacterium]|nr:YkgJ family cysteine cluster protein [Kofleriaceae bacterium]